MGQLTPSPSNSLMPQILSSCFIVGVLAEEMICAKAHKPGGNNVQDDFYTFWHGMLLF